MKNNYLPLIIIIVLIYMIHTNMGKNIESGDIFTQINITVQDILKQEPQCRYKAEVLF